MHCGTFFFLSYKDVMYEGNRMFFPYKAAFHGRFILLYRRTVILFPYKMALYGNIEMFYPYKAALYGRAVALYGNTAIFFPYNVVLYGKNETFSRRFVGFLTCSSLLYFVAQLFMVFCGCKLCNFAMF